MTALMFAARNNGLKLLKLLVEAGADVNIVDKVRLQLAAAW